MKLSSRLKRRLAVLSAALMLGNTGCAVDRVARPNVNEVQQPLQDRLVGITTNTGEEIGFDPSGGTIRDGEVHAVVNGMPYNILLTDVQRLWLQQREFSAMRTAGLTAGILVVAGAVLVAAAASTRNNRRASCPFIYSWDGTEYVFDADPFAGAIAKGLERDDYSELEHLRDDDGVYRLLITNEVDETQFTNLAELFVVDHAPNVRVVADENGNLSGYTNIRNLSAARDRYGSNLLSWLEAKDRKIWEPEAIAGPDGELAQEVVLTFPIEERTRRVSLIANIATGSWGSSILKQIVELHGRDTPNWLGSLENDPDLVEALFAWGEREAISRLAVEVEEPTGWEVRGALTAGGPYTAEDRVISLDVSKVSGRQLRIRLRPPAGFWAFNSFSLADGPGDAVHLKRIAAKTGITADGENIVDELASKDARYYSMPDMNDHAELTFAAPPRMSGTERTVFLHSRGWYQPHTQPESEPNIAAFSNITTVPGAAVQFAVDQFAEWRHSALQ